MILCDDVLMLLVVCHTGANKIYRDQLMFTEQEPWLFRGGLLGEMQVSRLSTHCKQLLAAHLLFVFEAILFMCTCVYAS